MATVERAASVPAGRGQRPAGSVRLAASVAASVAAFARGAAPALARQQQQQPTSWQPQGEQQQGAAREPDVVNRRAGREDNGV